MTRKNRQNNLNNQSKYQKFDTETISRNEIKGAEYNPRQISEDAKKRLRKMIAKHGLVQPLVWNRRTGNLVAGHQRLEALDTLEKSHDYVLQVAVVDVNEREERILNVQLNNPSMQGDWDLDKLMELTNDAGIAPDEFGFSNGDIAVLFGDERLDEIICDTQDVADAKEKIQEIKNAKKENMEKLKEQSAADFYFTVVCETEKQKKSILQKLGVPDWECFVNGRLIAAKFDI